MSEHQFYVGAKVSLAQKGVDHFKGKGDIRRTEQITFCIAEILPDGRVVLQKTNELPKGKKERTVPLEYIRRFKGK